MEQVAFKIAAISICLNLAVGLILYVTTAGGAYNSFTTTNGLQYDASYTTASEANIQASISGAPVENKNNFGEKILDFFTLGLYTNAKQFVLKTIYSIPTMMLSSGIIDNALYALIIVLLSVVYTVGTYELFSGKSILG